jgi:hypothetical protein
MDDRAGRHYVFWIEVLSQFFIGGKFCRTPEETLR